MTDDTTLPEIPSQLRRTSSPGFITGSPVRPTAAATRARESKIRKSIKTVTPVKPRTSVYAQMLRWSFAATLLVSAVMVGFMVLAAQSGCEELVTTERPEKSIHRTQRVRTVSIDID